MSAIPASESVAEPPAAPASHRFRSAGGEHLLIVPFSRIYDVPSDFACEIDHGDPRAQALIAALALPGRDDPALDQVPTPSPHSLSLNVSSSCNLGCTYCYASKGNFGGAQPTPMTWAVARAAIERLFAAPDDGGPLTIGFLGGEPFVNRALIHRSVAFATTTAARMRRRVGFSVTTNATLLEAADLTLLRQNPFAVTVSIDGGEALHDAQRPLARRAATGSFARSCRAIAPLLGEPGSARIAARATVLPADLDLGARFDAIVAQGFTEVGFSPLRAAPGGAAFEDRHWPVYLASLIDLARHELQRAVAGGPIRLTNLAVALKQLFRGAASPYACAAGGGYFSVAANGDWYACHRAIGQPAYRLGDSLGLDHARRGSFLRTRHVHAQTDCTRCWARYLCSGGCHQEAAARTESSCNFIRGWLDFCLTAYCEFSAARPDWFDSRARIDRAGDAA